MTYFKKKIDKPVKVGADYDLAVEFKSGFKDENLINNTAIAYKVIQALLEQSKTGQEQILALFMTATFKKIAYSALSIGIDSSFQDNVKLIASFAKHTKATLCIVAYHYPGGSIAPTQSDFALTLVIKNTLLGMGVKLMDLIIVNEVSYYSMYDEGFLNAKK